MNSDYIANSPKDLANMGKALFSTASGQNQLDEQVQMTRLLQSLGSTEELKYPLCVRHTHKAIPDFQLVSDKHKIAVEISKITSANLEHARALQTKNVKRTLTATEFFRKDQPRLSKAEVIQRGFGVPTFCFPPSLTEIEEGWWDAFVKEVQDKSKIQIGDNFCHGDEDWLVLWDRFGSEALEMQERLPKIQDWLANSWRAGWFKRIFIQNLYFEWQLALTVEGACWLSK